MQFGICVTRCSALILMFCAFSLGACCVCEWQRVYYYRRDKQDVFISFLHESSSIYWYKSTGELCSLCWYGYIKNTALMSATQVVDTISF